MTIDQRIQSFWKAYLASLPDTPGKKPPFPEVWSFSDNQKDADELGFLAREGVKTATCSLLWAYEVEQEQLPEAGDLSILTNWNGDPLGVIKTTSVEIKAYNEVDEAFAYDEGEGDRSLAYWRRVHWEVFSRECASIGREPSEAMPLVCERFQVIYSTE